MANEVVFKNAEINSFLNIDKSKGVVIALPENKKSTPITKLSGNQQTGKTSTLYGIEYLLGGFFNIDTKDFVNKKDGVIDGLANLSKGNKDYAISANGATGRIIVKESVKDSDKQTTVSSPKEFVRELVGPLGVSPMFLKDLSGKKQIQWFKDTFGNNPKIQKQEEDIVQRIDTKFADRRDKNRDAKVLTGALEANPLYQNYEANSKKFTTVISADKEKKKFEEVTAKKKQYDQYQTAVEGIEGEVEIFGRTIENLEKQLADAKKGKEEAELRVVNGKKWLKENEVILKEYPAAEKEWLNVAQKVTDYNSWKVVLDNEKKLIVLQDESQTLDAEIDELRKELLELTHKYLPKIKGLTIKVKTSLDSEEEGIYFEGMTLAQLSESELWGLFMQIWEAKGVRFIFCENVNSLGSDAISMLNKLAKEGCYIFVSEMDRSSKEMKVTFETKIQ